MHQFLAPAVVQSRQRAVHLAQCLLSLLFRFGIDQIRQTFRRGQVHFAVFDGAAGEFPPVRRSEIVQSRQFFQNSRQNRAPAVSLQFNDVFARKTVRMREKQHQRVVYRRSVGSADFGENSLARNRIFQPAQLFASKLGILSRNSDNGDPCFSLSGCRRKNGRIHFLSFLWRFSST